MAATAMTTNSSVASIGDIAFLALEVFSVKRFTFVLSKVTQIPI
jgi:hypothetical protein